MQIRARHGCPAGMQPEPQLHRAAQRLTRGALRVRAQTAANLMTDDLLMRTAQLTPEYRPLVDFHTEYSPTQARRALLFCCGSDSSGVGTPAVALTAAGSWHTREGPACLLAYVHKARASTA